MTELELEKEIAELRERAEAPIFSSKIKTTDIKAADNVAAAAEKIRQKRITRKSLKIIESLQAENKSWREMVESTNQTNQAMSKMLDKFEAENHSCQIMIEVVNKTSLALTNQIKELHAENQQLREKLETAKNHNIKIAQTLMEICEAGIIGDLDQSGELMKVLAVEVGEMKDILLINIKETKGQSNDR